MGASIATSHSMAENLTESPPASFYSPNAKNTGFSAGPLSWGISCAGTGLVWPVWPNVPEKSPKKTRGRTDYKCLVYRHLHINANFFLAFRRPFGYHSGIVRMKRIVVLVSGTGDDEILLRNVASVYIDQEANSVPGHRKLSCPVLRDGIIQTFQPLLRPLCRSGLFLRTPTSPF